MRSERNQGSIGSLGSGENSVTSGNQDLRIDLWIYIADFFFFFVILGFEFWASYLSAHFQLFLLLVNYQIGFAQVQPWTSLLMIPA
jgi:hypothetical protein